MIDKHTAPESWAMWRYELDAAADALAALLREADDDGFGETELRIYLGHLYAHLNRVWHSRDADAATALDPSDEQVDAWTAFPTDLETVG